MDEQQFTESCTKLLGIYKEKGSVTVDHVEVEVARFAGHEAEAFDDILHELNGAGVVVDGVVEPSTASLSPAVSPFAKKLPALARLPGQTVLDSRQIYYRDVGSFTLLDREGEVRLAKRRILVQNRIARVMSRTVPVADLLLDSLREALAGSTKSADVVSDPPRPTLPRGARRPRPLGVRIASVLRAKRALSDAVRAQEHAAPSASSGDLRRLRVAMSHAVLDARPALPFWEIAFERLDRVIDKLLLWRDQIEVARLTRRPGVVQPGAGAVLPYYYDDVEYLSLVRREVRELMEKLQHIRAVFANANLRLVSALARSRYRRGTPITIDDLEQSGNVGLLKAVDRFDPDRGTKFCTYATWWIRQSISRYDLENGTDIRVPVHLYGLARRVRDFELGFVAKAGRYPNDDEVARSVGSTVSEVRRVRFAPSQTVSLEQPMGEDEGSDVLASRVADPDIVDPEVALREVELKKMVRVALAQYCTDDEDQVIRKRFGLEPRADLPPARFSRVRERDLERSGLNKLRMHAAHLLHAFVAPKDRAPRQPPVPSAPSDDFFGPPGPVTGHRLFGDGQW